MLIVQSKSHETFADINIVASTEQGLEYLHISILMKLFQFLSPGCCRRERKSRAVIVKYLRRPGEKKNRLSDDLHKQHLLI